MRRTCGRSAGFPAAAAALAFGLMFYPCTEARAAPGESLPESSAAEAETKAETEGYRDDFMEELGREDLEALLSGSEDETISEQELEALVNEWIWGDPSAGVTGPEKNKFAVRDDPDTILQFDEAAGEYLYILPDGNGYRMNVPRNAVRAGPVILSAPDGGFIGVMKKDGEAFYQEDTTFTEPGSYELEYYSGGIDPAGDVNVNRMDTGAMGTTRSHIRFRIIPERWNGGGSLAPPEDFTLVSATLDSEPVPGGYEFRIRDDGLYKLTYAFDGDASIRYETEFLIDRTAPEIRLTPQIEGQKEVKPPVTFSVADPEAGVRVMKDGTPVETPGGRIEEGGWYSIIATDPAGNETVKTFYLQYGMARELKFLSGVIVTALAGFLIWLMVLRLKPRVR